MNFKAASHNQQRVYNSQPVTEYFRMHRGKKRSNISRSFPSLAQNPEFRMSLGWDLTNDLSITVI